MWTSIHGVPIPFKNPLVPNVLPLPHHFALNTCIKQPPMPPNFSWTCITKESPSYLTHYMSRTSPVTSMPQTNCIEHIHDILILKMEQGHIINIKSNNLNDALNIIKQLL